MPQSLSNFYIVFLLGFSQIELDQFSFTFVFYFRRRTWKEEKGKKEEKRNVFIT